MKYLLLLFSLNVWADFKVSDLEKNKMIKVIKIHDCITYKVYLIENQIKYKNVRKGDIYWFNTVEGYVRYTKKLEECLGCDC